MRRIKLIIEYDGSEYVGWQIQPNGLSIQQVLQDALFKLMQETIPVTGSGRTDAGVHALFQVAHFDCHSKIPAYKILKGINYYLPRDIRIISAEETDFRFHSRYDAVERVYRYYFSLKPAAILRDFRWEIDFPLNIEDMKRGAVFLPGNRDYRSFCSMKSPMNHYNCDIYSACFIEENHDLIFEIRANRYLHGMVRTIVGTLIDVGTGKRKPEDIPNIIMAKNRLSAGPSAPAKGLFLYYVRYK